MEFENTINNICMLEPVFDNKKTAVVLITNHEEIGNAVATISSMIDCSNKEDIWDIVILHNDCDYYDEEMIHYYRKKHRENVSIRMCRIRHEYNVGYVHIDKKYSQDYVTMAFLPFVMSKFEHILYVRTGLVFIGEVWESVRRNVDEKPFELYGDDELKAIFFNVHKFRKTYSAWDIKNALDSSDYNKRKDFFDKLEKESSNESKSHLIFDLSTSNDAKLFYKYAFTTPFFESLLYKSVEEKKEDINKDGKTFTGIYLFPFEKVEKGDRVVIYGNGNVGRQFIAQVKQTGYCRIVAVCDRKVQDGIVPIDEVRSLSLDKIVIAVASEKMSKEIELALNKIGVKSEQIVREIHRELYI